MMNRALAHQHRIERNHAMENDERYGGDMMNAIADVLTNVFGDRFEDDDEQAMVVGLAEAYTSAGYPAKTVRNYAVNDSRGYYFEVLDGITWQVAFDLGLVNP